MQLIWKRLKTDWASWMVIGFVALLPFGRAPEIPLSILALALPFLLRSPAHRARARVVEPPARRAAAPPPPLASRYFRLRRPPLAGTLHSAHSTPTGRSACW